MMHIKRRGFTLIELLVVIAIIAILAAILFPVFAKARDMARQATCTSNLKQLALGQSMYLQDYDEQFAFWDASANPINSWNNPNGAGWWMNEIQPYIKNYGVYACPNDIRDPSQTNGWGYSIIPNTNPVKYYNVSYGMSEWITSLGNGHFKLASILFYPANTVIMADSEGPLINDWDDCGGTFPYGFTRVWYANYDAWGPWGNEQNYEQYKQYARHSEGSVVAFIDGHVKYLKNKSFQIQVNPNGVCPQDGKKETPMFNPGHIPY